MRIAMVTDYYLPTIGGVQTSIKSQVEGLKKLGHEVCVLTPFDENNFEPNVAQLPSLGFRLQGYPFSLNPFKVERKIREIFTHFKPDVVHVHAEMLCSLLALKVAKQMKIPLVQTMHGRLDTFAANSFPIPALTTFIFRKIQQLILKAPDLELKNTYYTASFKAKNSWQNMLSQANYADRVIVPSAHFAKKLKYQGVYKPIAVLSNGLAAEILASFHSPTTRVRKPGERLKIIWVGRINQEKRPLLFLTAIKNLVTYFPDSLEVSMYGEGNISKEVQKFIDTHQLKQVSFKGAVSQAEILEAMERSQVFVSSSYDFDNQPMVLLEALASGLAIVLSDPDLAEITEPAGTLVAQDASANALADCIYQLISQPELLESLSSANISARGLALQESHLSQLVEIYQQTIGN